MLWKVLSRAARLILAAENYRYSVRVEQTQSEKGRHMLQVGLLGGFRVAGLDDRTWSEFGPPGGGSASFIDPGAASPRTSAASLSAVE
jgi:hypothetical protein